MYSLEACTNVNDLLEQRDAEITIDLAIFIQAKQIQMKFHEDFSITVVCYGEEHIAMSYLSLLGKKFRF